MQQHPEVPLQLHSAYGRWRHSSCCIVTVCCGAVYTTVQVAKDSKLLVCGTRLPSAPFCAATAWGNLCDQQTFSSSDGVSDQIWNMQ